jgi:hypothetical protein
LLKNFIRPKNETLALRSLLKALELLLNINGQFSKAGKEIRLPALKSKPVLSIDELADFCNELSKPKEKKPSSKDKKTS